jgi:hypothetical protein
MAMPKRMLLLLVGLGAACNTGPSSPSATAPALVEGSRGFATVYIPGVGEQRVEYVVKNGRAVYAGDVTLSPEQIAASQANEPGSPESDSTTVHSALVGRALQSYRWPNGVIPYSIDRNTIPVGSSLDTVVNGAMTEWAQLAPLTFKPYTGSGDYLLWQATDPAGDGGQSSSVGHIAGSGKHTISLATDVGGFPGIPRHELGHIIGLYHEQQRADRDQYVVVYDGISPVGCSGSACYPNHWAPCGGVNSDYERYSNVAQGNYGNDGNDYTPFDFQSIMIYGSDTNGCCNGTPCMTGLNGAQFTGNTDISAWDAAGVKQMYLFVELKWLSAHQNGLVLL